MYGTDDVDCEQCIYGAAGHSNDIVCCYYGSEECDPFGQCKQFEQKDNRKMYEDSQTRL